MFDLSTIQLINSTAKTLAGNKKPVRMAICPSELRKESEQLRLVSSEAELNEPTMDVLDSELFSGKVQG